MEDVEMMTNKMNHSGRGITAADVTIDDVLDAYEPAEQPSTWQKAKMKAGAAISIAALLGALYLPGVLSGCSCNSNDDRPVAASVDAGSRDARPSAGVSEEPEEAEETASEEISLTCAETRYNFERGTTDFTDDGAPEGIERFILNQVEAGHNTFYIAGFASQEWGSNTELDDQPQNTRLAQRRAYTLANIIHDIARNNNLNIALRVTNYSEESAFAEERATGERLYAPNRTGVISNRPLEDPSQDDDLAEELRSHDARDVYNVQCGDEPEDAEEASPAGQESRASGTAPATPRAHAISQAQMTPSSQPGNAEAPEQQPQTPEAEPGATENTEYTPDTTPLSQLAGQADTPEPVPTPDPAQITPDVDYTQQPVPAPTGEVTVSYTEDGNATVTTQDGAEVQFGPALDDAVREEDEQEQELPPTEAVPEDPEPVGEYMTSPPAHGGPELPEAPEAADGLEEPEVSIVTDEEAQLMTEMQNFQTYSQESLDTIMGYVNLAETVVQECGDNPPGSTLCSMESIDAQCGEDRLPYTPPAPGETTACREAQIEAELSQTEYNPILDDVLRDEMAEAFTAYDRYA